MADGITAIKYSDRINWSELIPEEEWLHDRLAIEALRARGIRFALGGGLAFSAYTGRLRNTKDVDLFLLAEDRERAIDAVLAAGFHDYFDEKPYDREWIFRAKRDSVIVDLIWKMANYRGDVDEGWLDHGEEVVIRGAKIRCLPVEELIWSKLYVLQRERCDWTDMLNLLDARGPDLDWEHLIDRVGPDLRLFAGLVNVFGWMRPARARQFPKWVWSRLGLTVPEQGATEQNGERVALLDSRDWFGPNVRAA